MLHKHTAYKYEMLYKGPFVITRCFTNSTVNLYCGSMQIKSNIRHIKTYKSDTNVENINPKNMSDDVKI